MMVLLRFSRFTPRRVGEPADGLAGLGRAGSPPSSPVSLSHGRVRKRRFIEVICRDPGQALSDRFVGEVPGTLEELMTLPGVGHKTANMVG